MNNHSIIRLIILFFLLIFALINGLFWIAHNYFANEMQGDRMRRFALAERLIHHRSGDFGTELKQLMIAPSSLSPDFLRKNGITLEEFPFGRVMEHNGKIYFLKSPPPMNPFDRPPLMFDPSLPPPPPFDRHDLMVLEDLKVTSIWPIWTVFIMIDLLVLLFFIFILKKLTPLNRLKNAIMNFKEGDTRLDVPIGGKDEISQITHEFNLALEKIASMKEARALFLRNILHELKTPIMKGALSTDCLEESEDQKRLKRIFNRMDYLLREFSTMERFSSGEMTINPQEYRFVDILDHTCDILMCEKKNIVIKGEDSALIINVDFELFAIALKNLLDNAFKYSDTKPTLFILQHAIEICSLGEPLPEENRTFTKPFNRTYESSMTGLGLGLYITNAILHKHGYRLEYHYDTGLNCFRIVL
ncbi:integral membrane sensor signal transduction histidine kinase [Sulfuricurvum kujiense DSM 16994]|uniref:histidine kinase n=1 Tax=Sulfuricurvum kujiense (strain ATCC BAA-921 / DSM 16994 / JCM 11577 / YK-1) TaxID=709032 RepID=E4TXL4_SULKY|nr:ArsS family sensor histidine kinase [Sulfuricurvum kujiense]ADR33923.1 integral membrane sensor signal transduction histidine kinase [Sulfuricurvum kujiense DSM 16994]